MPKKIIPTVVPYRGFESILQSTGFVMPGSKEESRDLKEKGISLDNPPRMQYGQGDLYLFYALNGYRVKIRPAIAGNPFRPLPNAGWALIENEKGKAVMFAPRHHKTKNYLENLLLSARILQEIVLNRPLCRCGENMNIENIHNSTRDYQYVCSDIDNPYKNHTSVIEVYEFLLEKIRPELANQLRIRLSKESYNRYLAARNGKRFGEGVKIRKPWPKKK